MGMDTVLDSARADVKTACTALRDLQELAFWKIPELDLLALAQPIEGLAGLGFAARIILAVFTRALASGAEIVSVSRSNAADADPNFAAVCRVSTSPATRT